MATRTTATAVKEKLDTDLTDAIVEAFIASANLMLTQILSGASISVATTYAADIECWIACHMIAATRDQQVERDMIDASAAYYQGKTAMYLESTYYGQMAIMMLRAIGIDDLLTKEKAWLRAVDHNDWNGR